MRVLLVDDHEELQAMVQRTLTADGYDVTCAGSVAAARELMARSRPDLVILDLGLPDGPGEVLCREIHQQQLTAALMILTAKSAVASRVRCLDLGADDFLGKPFALAELRARVRALTRRARPAPLPTLTLGSVTLEFRTRRAFLDGQEAPITAREWAILAILAQNPGRVVSRAELLEQIWGRSGSAEASSLEVLVGRIRRKLGGASLRTVRGEGYAFGDATG